MPYRAVLFDMDGTLLNTLTDIAKSTNRVLAERDYPQHPEADYKYFVGEGARKLITDVLPNNALTDQNINECLQAFEADYSVNWKTNTRPYNGIETLLNELTTAGMKMTILSNKPHHITMECVTEMLAQWKFEVVFGQRDHISPKPDPTAALEIADILDIPPSEFLYLGDTKIDMATANSAGMYAVGAVWGFRPRQELIDSGAKTIIDKPEELLDLLA